jgi:hypothetical protein
MFLYFEEDPVLLDMTLYLRSKAKYAKQTKMQRWTLQRELASGH